MVAAALNPVCVLILLALAGVLRGGVPGFHHMLEWCRRPVALTLIGSLALAGVGSRIVAGYYAPTDFAQEVVAARRFDATGTFYSTTVDADIRAWLAAEPPPHQNWLPRSERDGFARLRHDLPDLYGAQAHPPLLLLSIWPLVHFLGGYNAYLLVTAATVVAATAGVTLMLWWAIPGSVDRWWLLATLLALGWQPTLSSIRHGQVGVIIAALVIAGWLALRKKEDIAGGLVIGIAAALKLYPVLFAGLLLRRPRALAGLIGVGVLALALVAVAAGLSEVQSYRAAASLVVQRFGLAPNNVSLWARLSPLGIPAQLAEMAAIGGALVALTLLAAPVAGRRPLWPDDVEDFRTAALICLMLLLSPIAWEHYFFLLMLPIWLILRRCLIAESRTAVASCLVGMLVVSLPDAPFWRLQALVQAPIVRAVVSPTFAMLVCWASCLWCARFGDSMIRSAPAPSSQQA